nr:hypothetical protein [Tanacetum cinerariifolium]
MRITRDNQPLNLTVYDKFVLKMMGFSEWVEIHALASNAAKLGIPLLRQLIVFELSSAERKVGMKRKRWFELIHETFVKENKVVDGEQRDLTLPEGVVGKAGMVIKELKAEIFLYNGNFDMVFQRRSEYALASNHQLTRIQNLIKIDFEYA